MEKGAAPAGAGAVAAILTSWSPSRVKIERLHDHNTGKVYGGVNFKRRLRCASGAKRIWHEFVSNQTKHLKEKKNLPGTGTWVSVSDPDGSGFFRPSGFGL